MEYLKFKITKNAKREIARSVKSRLLNLSKFVEYDEFLIVYRDDIESFDIVDTLYHDYVISLGYVIYSVYTYSKFEKIPTLADIEKNIFGC